MVFVGSFRARDVYGDVENGMRNNMEVVVSGGWRRCGCGGRSM